MDDPDRSTPGLSVEYTFDESTPDLEGWSQLLRRPEELPLRRRPGLFGWICFVAKRLLRPLVKAPQNEYWEFQRRYNLAVAQFLSSQSDEFKESQRVLSGALGRLGKDLLAVQTNLVGDCRCA